MVIAFLLSSGQGGEDERAATLAPREAAQATLNADASLTAEKVEIEAQFTQIAWEQTATTQAIIRASWTDTPTMTNTPTATDTPTVTNTPEISDLVEIEVGDSVKIGLPAGLSGEGIATLGQDIVNGAEIALTNRPTVTIYGVEFTVE